MSDDEVIVSNVPRGTCFCLTGNQQIVVPCFFLLLPGDIFDLR